MQLMLKVWCSNNVLRRVKEFLKKLSVGWKLVIVEFMYFSLFMFIGYTPGTICQMYMLIDTCISNCECLSECLVVLNIKIKQC